MLDRTSPQQTPFSDAQLVFLVSQPRAGSTLLQAILAGLPGCRTAAEPWLMLPFIFALRETGHTAVYDATVAGRALNDFLGELPGGIRAYNAALRDMALRLYGEACRTEGKTWFLDKTPRYYYILPELGRVFPKARFIFLFRNPLAVLASILQTWIKSDWLRLSYFRDDLIAAPALLRDGLSQLQPRATAVHYERLVVAPEETVSELCRWLEQPYSPQLLDYGERPLPAGRYGDPTGVRRHERPTTASLESWQEMGRVAQTRHLAESYLDTLGPELLADIGYDAADLRARLITAPRPAGRVTVSWDEALAGDASVARRIQVILAASGKRKPGETLRQLARLLRDEAR